MTLKTLLLSSCLPLALLSACGGNTDSDSESGTKNANPASTGEKNGAEEGTTNEGEIAGSTEGKDESCDSYCSGLSACAEVSTEGCSVSCTESGVVSRGGQEVLANCIDSELCTDELSEADGLVAFACLKNGLEDIPLSGEASTYCATSVDAINTCLGEPTGEFELGTCEETIALASSDYIADMNSCAKKDCDLMDACISASLLTNLPLEEILSLKEGDTLPASLISDLMAVGVVLGQLGLSESLIDSTDLFGGDDSTMQINPVGLGGSSSR